MSINIGFLQDKAKYEAAQQVMADLDLKYVNIEFMRQMELLGDSIRQFESWAERDKLNAKLMQERWCKGYETGSAKSNTVAAYITKERFNGLMLTQQKLAQAINRHSNTVTDGGNGYTHISVFGAKNVDKVLDDNFR